MASTAAFRDKYIAHFQPEVDLALQHIHLDGLDPAARSVQFYFSGDRVGPFIAHAYQYEVGRSTAWIFETDPETFTARWVDRLRREAIRPDRMAEDLWLVPRRPPTPDQPLDVAEFSN